MVGELVTHRHLNSTEWTLAAIDSLLERGDLPDWRELFAAVRRDEALAGRVMHIARVRRAESGGASELAEHLVGVAWPNIGEQSSTPQSP
jgi:hypothetical protein